MKTLEQLAREAGFRVYGDCIVAADGRVSGVATESIARFRAACRAEALEEAAQWQPIETAPKDGTDIIVMYMHIETQIVHAAFWLDGEGVDAVDVGWWSYKYSEVGRVHLTEWMTPTHWMPLPQPPAILEMK